MNTTTLVKVSAGLALVSIIVTANLWRELRMERTRTAALQTRLTDAPDRVSAIIPAPQVDTGTSMPPAASVLSATAPQSNSDALPVTVPPVPAVTFSSNAISEEELLKDPEYRKARLNMLRSSIAQNYPGLAEELGLTQDETDRLFTVIAETQIAISDATLSTQDRQALQRQRGDSLRALLGDVRYAQWQDYQPTRSSRVQASSFATTLARAGAPLDGQQVKSLAAAVAAEQKSLQQDVVALGRTVDPANPQSQKQAQEALKKRQAESNQRILDGATPYLNPQQLGILRSQFEQQDAINRATARVREISGAAPGQQ